MARISNTKIKGFIKNIETGELRRFQFNPETHKYGRSTSFSETSSPASPYPQISYSKGDSTTFSVSLYMHGKYDTSDLQDNSLYGSGLNTGIESFIKFLDSFMAQPDTSGFIERNPKPKLLLFCYGNFIRKCVMKTYDYEYTRYDTDGNPLQANINLSLLEISGVNKEPITRPYIALLPTTVTNKTESGETVIQEIVKPTEVNVFYSPHCENLAWLPEVSNGAQAGTTGESLRLEALIFRIEAGSLDLHLVANCHIQDVGWNGTAYAEGTVCGTVGEATRLEALKFWLIGTDAVDYSVFYRVHIENLGWLEWRQDGDPVGSAGFSLRAEAIEIMINHK